jgi:hypothetical protein
VVDILKRLIHKGQVHAEKLIARYLKRIDPTGYFLGNSEKFFQHTRRVCVSVAIEG